MDSAAEFWLSLLGIGAIAAAVYIVGFLHGFAWYHKRRPILWEKPEPKQEDDV